MPRPVVQIAAILLPAFLLAGTASTWNTAQSNESDVSELRPGGDATSKSKSLNRNAFSHSSGNLSFEEELSFKLGNAVFRKLWVSSPASTRSSDGLGPLYNARSCQRCHLKDGRGHPPAANWPDDNAISMLMRLAVPPANDAERELLASGRANVIADAVYGTQLQDFSVQGQDAEGKIEISYTDKVVKLADGETVILRSPHYRLTNMKYGSPRPDLQLSPRVAPQMIGLGLLEAIPEKALQALEDPDDTNGDGISGRANVVWSLEHKKTMRGRFGWKAGMPTIRQQTAAAFSGDMGLSTELFPAPFGDCTPHQKACRNAPHGDERGPEVDPRLMDLIVFYSQTLAVPQRRNADDTEVQRGRALFREIGCASCHHPSHRTAPDAAVKPLANQVIWPYTDLLLHDMGPGLADGLTEGKATGTEWRTPPLWGIGLTETVSGHTQFLHDGRARNVQEAILWHGGEGQAARDAYAKLSAKDRAALIAFVNSL